MEPIANARSVSKMPNYHRMNKIYEEEGGSKRSIEEELSYADHEASVAISAAEDAAEELGDDL